MTTEQNINDGVWFIYDGECPLCRHAAKAAQIKQQYGSLHLIDARQQQNHPLLHEVNKRQYDLDQGMVIYHHNNFYHGDMALAFMGKIASTHGLTNKISHYIFRHRMFAKYLYPYLKAIRNRLIEHRDIERINNLSHNHAPIFQAIFGDSWQQLPPSLKRHYINRPYCKERTRVEGHLDIFSHRLFYILKPFYRLLGGIPIENKNNVFIRVDFDSDLHSEALHFNRSFYFDPQKPYRFRSKMIQQQGSKVIEIMRFGICWKMQFLVDHGKVYINHRGYAVKCFRWFIPLPLTYLIGRGDAEEFAIDDQQFAMKVVITHPLLGPVYGYSGTFRFIDHD